MSVTVPNSSTEQEEKRVKKGKCLSALLNFRINNEHFFHEAIRKHLWGWDIASVAWSNFSDFYGTSLIYTSSETFLRVKSCNS